MERFCAPKQMAVYVLDLFAIKTAETCCFECVCVHVCMGVCVITFSVSTWQPKDTINVYTCKATNRFVGHCGLSKPQYNFDSLTVSRGKQHLPVKVCLCGLLSAK